MNKLIVANFKCYKTTEECLKWLDEVGEKLVVPDGREAIVCPSFVSLEAMRRRIEECGYNIKLGAESVSHFEEGAFTGEVSAKMLAGVVEYVLVGHSERRSKFGETNEDMRLKVELCLKYGLKPLLLVRGVEDEIVEGVEYFAWEPVSAIGTGQAIGAAEANGQIVSLRGGQEARGMYGGSVKPDNIGSFFAENEIYGAVIGSAALDSGKFLEMVSNSA
jgi:triosephosphate isomerase